MASDRSHRVLRMRIDLDPISAAEPRWPAGVGVRSFTLSDAERLHTLLVHAYRDGGGEVAEFGSWLPAMTGDQEYDPALWILAEEDATLVGAILCWTSGFVKDLVVHESWRRRGLGEALLRHAFATLAGRGLVSVELKVHASNASAIRVYERVGLRVVERLGEH